MPDKSLMYGRHATLHEKKRCMTMVRTAVKEASCSIAECRFIMHHKKDWVVATLIQVVIKRRSFWGLLMGRLNPSLFM